MNVISSVAASMAAADAVMPVHEALAHDIRRFGVEMCFGLMSEDTIGLVVALDALGVRYCSFRHETNAVLAAEGYASATARLGIAIVGRGPAAANAMHGLMNAARARSPVLVIMGEEEPFKAPNGIGPDYKSYDAAAVVTAAGITAFKAMAATAARPTLRTAVRAALAGAAVTLHVPTSVMNAATRVGPDKQDLADAVAAPPPTVGRRQAIEAAVDVIGRSARPLIVAGAGAHRSNARGALERLADRTGALLITSAKGKDLFAGSPWDLGICGSYSHSVARKHVDTADCVLVFGAGLNYYTTSNGTFFPDVPVVHVDAAREHIGRWHPADVAIVGDARRVAEQLADAVPERDAAEKPFHRPDVLREIRDFDIARDIQDASTHRTLDPRFAALALAQLLPPNRNVVYDAGNFMMVVPYIPVPGPGRFRFTSDFNSMGAGFGTAIGVALARPEDVTVFVVGDGGFMMTLSELETAARLGVRLVIIVMNDCAYGAELHMSRIYGKPDDASVFPDIDLAPLAATLGFEGRTVRTREDLEGCRTMLAACDGPILLDCKVNAEVQAPFIAELVAKLGQQ